MTTEIESIKAAYLEEFNRSIPRLKELAVTLRAFENDPNESAGDCETFWKLTPDPKTNYELSQLAYNLSEMNEFWMTHPDNNPQAPAIPVNVPDGDRRKIEEYVEYFKLHFPKLKELAKQAAKLSNCITDDELKAALDLLGDLAGPDLTDDCRQFFHEWSDR